MDYELRKRINGLLQQRANRFRPKHRRRMPSRKWRRIVCPYMQIQHMYTVRKLYRDDPEFRAAHDLFFSEFVPVNSAEGQDILDRMWDVSDRDYFPGDRDAGEVWT
jgi:hypothetical protein